MDVLGIEGRLTVGKVEPAERGMSSFAQLRRVRDARLPHSNQLHTRTCLTPGERKALGTQDWTATAHSKYAERRHSLVITVISTYQHGALQHQPHLYLRQKRSL